MSATDLTHGDDIDLENLDPEHHITENLKVNKNHLDLDQGLNLSLVERSQRKNKLKSDVRVRKKFLFIWLCHALLQNEGYQKSKFATPGGILAILICDVQFNYPHIDIIYCRSQDPTFYFLKT